MKLFRTLLAATAAVTVTLLGTSTAQAFEPAVQAPGADFTGIAALSNCSASLVRYAESASTDKALVLTVRMMGVVPCSGRPDSTTH
ncbi:hypothetical protein OG555_21145 [Kribbella sp. NBC_01484]|uniref:hypothetical protein n=1 Tax=Kribbella sp. NBC_01484 TaxID=2903579 RepID=UPI002E37213C|nr:hypothetical protein [Kribbella sp. NBC_01484]